MHTCGGRNCANGRIAAEKCPPPFVSSPPPLPTLRTLPTAVRRELGPRSKALSSGEWHPTTVLHVDVDVRRLDVVATTIALGDTQKQEADAAKKEDTTAMTACTLMTVTCPLPDRTRIRVACPFVKACCLLRLFKFRTVTVL